MIVCDKGNVILSGTENDLLADFCWLYKELIKTVGAQDVPLIVSTLNLMTNAVESGDENKYFKEYFEEEGKNGNNIEEKC